MSYINENCKVLLNFNDKGAILMNIITTLRQYLEGIEFALRHSDFTIDEFRLCGPDDFMYTDGYILLKNSKYSVEINASWRTVIYSSFSPEYHAINLVAQLYHRATGNPLTVIFDQKDWDTVYSNIESNKYLKCTNISGEELIRHLNKKLNNAEEITSIFI